MTGKKRRGPREFKNLFPCFIALRDSWGIACEAGTWIYSRIRAALATTNRAGLLHRKFRGNATHCSISVIPLSTVKAGGLIRLRERQKLLRDVWFIRVASSARRLFGVGSATLPILCPANTSSGTPPRHLFDVQEPTFTLHVHWRLWQGVFFLSALVCEERGFYNSVHTGAPIEFFLTGRNAFSATNAQCLPAWKILKSRAIRTLLEKLGNFGKTWSGLKNRQQVGVAVT